MRMLVLAETAVTGDVEDGITLEDAARILHFDPSYVIYLVQQGSLLVNPAAPEGRCFSRKQCEGWHQSKLIDDAIGTAFLRQLLAPLGLWHAWQELGN